MAEAVCAALEPAPYDIAAAHQVACHAVTPGSGHSATGAIAHAA
jgi:hypothetical protein